MGLVAAYLLDIEGTTTPIDFVTKTLFPFARAELRRYVPLHAMSSEICALSREYEQDVEAGNNPPPWDGSSRDSVIPYLEWLMDQDRKSTPLKSIQGKIWQDGYETGKLRGVVYADVEPAFRRWKEAGKKIAIYSSGSVLAQQLIFGNLDKPLTSLIDDYFDTEVGGKRVSSSYAEISRRLSIPPDKILFLSDVAEEVDAAKAVGMQSIQVFREGIPAGSDGIENFDGLD